jgi:hypothetical protein
VLPARRAKHADSGQLQRRGWRHLRELRRRLDVLDAIEMPADGVQQPGERRLRVRAIVCGVHVEGGATKQHPRDLLEEQRRVLDDHVCRREVERGAAKRQPLNVAANTVGESAMPRERLFIGIDAHNRPVLERGTQSALIDEGRQEIMAASEIQPSRRAWDFRGERAPVGMREFSSPGASLATSRQYTRSAQRRYALLKGDDMTGSIDLSNSSPGRWSC